MLEARLGGAQGAVWDFVQVVVHQPVAWGVKVSHGFKSKVVAIGKNLNIHPDHLMACMAFETGRTFSPSVSNAAGSGAVGLIQFMKTTAMSMSTSTAGLAAMSAVDQLNYVERFMADREREAHVTALWDVEDVYMAILYPAAIGKASTYALFHDSGTARDKLAYQQNRGLDKDGDKTVTKFEATAGVRSLLAEGRTSRWYG